MFGNEDDIVGVSWMISCNLVTIRPADWAVTGAELSSRGEGIRL
jgi:hypothetical protein